MRRLLIFLSLLALVGVSVGYYLFQQKGETPKLSRDGLVIFFGNSLTAGVGAGQAEDFPTLVSKQLGLTNVVNSGVSGDTSETALQRLGEDVLDQKPALVVVELSGNDFLRAIEANETIKNLDLITTQIKDSGAVVVLVHIRFPAQFGDYEGGFKKLAEKHNVKVVWNSLDGILSKPSLMADQIHPNAAGYRIMAERVSVVLKDYFE